MSDLIRREDAFSKFEKACTCDSVDKNGMKRGEIKTALTWEGIRKILENMPSAEPEQRWISVSERLPEEDDDVLLLMAEGEMAVGQRRGVNYWDGYRRRAVIVAWMPLPEPWRGE